MFKARLICVGCLCVLCALASTIPTQMKNKSLFALHFLYNCSNCCLFIIPIWSSVIMHLGIPLPPEPEMKALEWMAYARQNKMENNVLQNVNYPITMIKSMLILFFPSQFLWNIGLLLYLQLVEIILRSEFKDWHCSWIHILWILTNARQLDSTKIHFLLLLVIIFDIFASLFDICFVGCSNGTWCDCIDELLCLLISPLFGGLQ